MCQQPLLPPLSHQLQPDLLLRLPSPHEAAARQTHLQRLNALTVSAREQKPCGQARPLFSRESFLFPHPFLRSSLPESRKFLLYARQIELRGVDIDNPYYNYIISFTVPDIDNVTAVDFDAVEHRIYWSDVRTQTIKRAFINGTGVETVVSAGKSSHLRLFKRLKS